MGGASPLGNLVVGVTVNTLGLSRGLAGALALTASGFGAMSQAALLSSSRIVQALGLIGAAAAATTAGVLGLVAAFTGLGRAGATIEAAGHNVEQVFGSWSVAVQEGAAAQAAAFGQSKSEYLSYAATIGREFEKLGVSADVAAAQTVDLLDTVQRMAQSRRISFGEAFGITQGRGALFTEEQVRGFAVEKGILTNRNMLLNEGTEAILRNMMAIERINDTTEESVVSGDNWNAQLAKLQGNAMNLAQVIGSDLEPAFVKMFQAINDLLETMIQKWDEWRGTILATLGPLGIAIDVMAGGGGGGGGGFIGPGGGINAALDEIDARNQAAIDKAAKRQAVGEAMGRGGGGPSGGFQGSLVEFSRRVQGSAFNQRQIAIQQRQLDALERLVRLAEAGKNPALMAGGAAGGAASILANMWK
jgi:hypothetical protein